MSENNNTPNEQELWDVLSAPVTTETKTEKPPKTEKAPKTEGRFLKPKAEPAVQEKTPAPAEQEEPKSGKGIDGFFIACMVGVAAVSVVATLLVSSMFGGKTPAPTVPGAESGAAGETISAAATELELENAELRAQLELQKEQIKDLQNDLMELMGAEEYLATAPSNPEESNDVLDAQVKAMETLAKIQEAYADFDREKLEELIPEMDAQLGYLTPEALNNYYLILEYVEQPSNG